MQDTDTNAPVEAQTPPEPPLIEVGTYPEQFYREAHATFVVPKEPPHRSVRRSLFSSIGRRGLHLQPIDGGAGQFQPGSLSDGKQWEQYPKCCCISDLFVNHDEERHAGHAE